METFVTGGESITIGSVIADRYEVLDVLGKGAMGAVVKVSDRALDNDIIALKLLYSHLVQDQVLLSRFRNEVLIVRQLSHPNIVRLYDFGETPEGDFYIAMELVKGENLNSVVIAGKNFRPNFQQCLKILYEVALGLEHAHSRKIVHRDIKPDNILITEDGAIKITDFGLARTLTVDKGFTNTGEAVGTPYYMAPEQIQGEAVDGRADIYSFAILSYELVTGRRPFESDDWFKLAALHIQQPFPKFATKENKIPKWFEEMVILAAAKKPKDRFQSITEILSILSEKMDSRPQPWTTQSNLLTSNSVKERKSKVSARFIENKLKRLTIFFALGSLTAIAIAATTWLVTSL